MTWHLLKRTGGVWFVLGVLVALRVWLPPLPRHGEPHAGWELDALVLLWTTCCGFASGAAWQEWLNTGWMIRRCRQVEAWVEERRAELDEKG